MEETLLTPKCPLVSINKKVRLLFAPEENPLPFRHHLHLDAQGVVAIDEVVPPRHIRARIEFPLRLSHQDLYDLTQGTEGKKMRMGQNFCAVQHNLTYV